MALHINKDRSNLDSHDKTLAAEDFVNSILDGLDIKSDKNTSSSNDDDIFYEWSSDFDRYAFPSYVSIDYKDKKTPLIPIVL